MYKIFNKQLTLFIQKVISWEKCLEPCILEKKISNMTLSIATCKHMTYLKLNLRFCNLLQDGEIWTFSVRAFDSGLPEHTISVNYDGFAEG